jgi:hypothetical protein
MADGEWQPRRIMDCGGKDRVTPLSQAECFTHWMECLSLQKRRRRFTRPAQSKISQPGAILLCLWFSIFGFQISTRPYSMVKLTTSGCGNYPAAIAENLVTHERTSENLFLRLNQ